MSDLDTMLNRLLHVIIDHLANRLSLPNDERNALVQSSKKDRNSELFTILEAKIEKLEKGENPKRTSLHKYILDHIQLIQCRLEDSKQNPTDIEEQNISDLLNMVKTFNKLLNTRQNTYLEINFNDSVYTIYGVNNSFMGLQSSLSLAGRLTLKFLTYYGLHKQNDDAIKAQIKKIYNGQFSKEKQHPQSDNTIPPSAIAVDTENTAELRHENQELQKKVKALTEKLLATEERLEEVLTELNNKNKETDGYKQLFAKKVLQRTTRPPEFFSSPVYYPNSDHEGKEVSIYLDDPDPGRGY